MLKRILLIGLLATSLVAMLETETRAVFNVGGTGVGGCYCRTSVALGSVCKTSTNCDRSRDQGTCDDAGPTFCPIASLERSEFFAAAPGPEQTEICADIASPEPIVTFADTPSPEQIATFAALPNSEPRIILVAKPTPSPEPAPNDYECSSFGAGAGNLTNNPGATSCSFRPDQVAVQCQNPAGGNGGQGTPFSPSVTLNGTDILDPTNVTGRGRWFANSVYTQEQLFTAIGTPADACKANWSVIPNTLIILAVRTDVRTNRCGFTDPALCETSLEYPPDDRWISDCTVGTSIYDWNCTTVVHCLDLSGAERDACLCQAPSPSGGTVPGC